jgi:hypothetical protein
MQLKYIALARALGEKEEGARQDGEALGSLASPPAALNELQSPGRLHMVTLLRDPFERIVSWFFFVRPGCTYGDTEEELTRAAQNGIPMDWLMENKPEFICKGDFESFVPYAKEIEAQSVSGRVRGGGLGHFEDVPCCLPARVSVSHPLSITLPSASLRVWATPAT